MSARAGLPWSMDELEACVATYASLWKAEQLGGTPDRAEAIRQLEAGPLSQRKRGTARMRFSNIAHVMTAEGRRAVTGYKPLAHISDAEYQRLLNMLRAEGVL